MTGTPDFSVLIVNYNGGAYVQGALDSLKRQTHRSFEVILLDNASTDGSVDGLDASGLPGFRLMRRARTTALRAAIISQRLRRAGDGWRCSIPTRRHGRTGWPRCWRERCAIRA